MSNELIFVGDSYAQGLYDAAILDPMAMPGFIYHDAAIGGSAAAGWTQEPGPSFLNSKLDLMAQDGGHKVAVVLMGGNDLRLHWNVGISQTQRETLLIKIAQDTLTVINQILAHPTNPSVFLSTYAYPNRNQSLIGQNQESIQVIADWGNPTQLMINALFDEMWTTSAAAAVANDQGIIDASLVLQHAVYGVGDRTEPSPDSLMLNLLHANEAGFGTIWRHIAGIILGE